MLKWLSLIFRSLIGVVAVAAAVGVFALLVATKPHPPKKEALEPPMVVEAVIARRVALPISWSGYGTARPLDAAEVAAEVSARVIERPGAIEAGRTVAAGDVLVRLDDTTYAARAESIERLIDQALAELDALEIEQGSLAERVSLSEEQIAASRRDLDRARRAESLGAGNESQIDARVQQLQRDLITIEQLRDQLARVPSRREGLRALLAGRRADLRSAQADLERAVIRSPIAGVIQRVDVEAGDYVLPGSPVARVVDLSKIEIPVRLPVSAAGLVRAGDRAVLKADDAAGTAWRGAVVRLAPEADAQTRTMTVFVVVEQAATIGDASALQPGRFVAVRVESERTRAALVVPRRVVEVDRIKVGEPIDTEAARAAAEENPRFARIDFSMAEHLMRVREVEVNVERYVEIALPEIDPLERQWAVLDETGVTPARALREGHRVLLSNLEQLRIGSIIDVHDGAVGEAEARREGAVP